jgi:hypothetical protein
MTLLIVRGDHHTGQAVQSVPYRTCVFCKELTTQSVVHMLLSVLNLLKVSIPYAKVKTDTYVLWKLCTFSTSYLIFLSLT